MKKQSKDSLSLQWFVSQDKVILQAKRQAKALLRQYQKKNAVQYNLALCQDEVAITLGYQNWFDLQHQRKIENEKVIYPQFIKNLASQACGVFENMIVDCWKKKADYIHFEIREKNECIHLRQYGQMNVYEPEISLPLNIDQLLQMVFKHYWNSDFENYSSANREIEVVDLENNIPIKLKLRFQHIPCYNNGYNMVIKIYHDKKMSLEELGYSPQQIDSLRQVMNDTEPGMLVISGHVGSGMHTTSKSIMQEINGDDSSTCIELDESNIKKAKNYFKQGNQILPTVHTKHILTTIHSASSEQALLRLVDLGLDKNWVENNALPIIHQTVMPVLCNHCKTSFKLAHLPGHKNHSTYLKLIPKLPQPEISKVFLKGEGCQKCQYLGYTGEMVCATVTVSNQVVQSMTDIAMKNILLGHLSPVDVEEKIGF